MAIAADQYYLLFLEHCADAEFVRLLLPCVGQYTTEQCEQLLNYCMDTCSSVRAFLEKMADWQQLCSHDLKVLVLRCASVQCRLDIFLAVLEFVMEEGRVNIAHAQWFNTRFLTFSFLQKSLEVLRVGAPFYVSPSVETMRVSGPPPFTDSSTRKEVIASLLDTISSPM